MPPECRTFADSAGTRVAPPCAMITHRQLTVLLSLTVCTVYGCTSSDDGSDTAQRGTPHVELLVEGAELQGANGLFFDADDRLLAASVFSRQLFVIDPDTGETLETFGAEQGVTSPDDVTVGPDGTIYVTNIVGGTVGAIPSSGAPFEVANLGLGVNSITVSDDGRLFVGLDFLGDGLYELDPSGVAAPRQVIAAPGWINGMDFGPDGLIYGPQWSQARIVQIDPDTGAMATIATEFDSLAAAVKFDSAGALHAVEHSPANVIRVDVQTGARTILARDDCGGDNLAFDSNDRLFISCGDDGSIHEVRRDGTLREVKRGGMAAPSGIIVEDRSGRDEVTVMAAQSIEIYDGASGERIARRHLPFAFGELTAHAGGLAARHDGEYLLVTDWTPGSGVEIWDLQAGTVVEEYAAAFAFDVIRFQGNIVVSQHFANNVAVLGQGDPVPLVEGIASPTGLAATDDDLYVASYSTGQIFLAVENGEPVQPPRPVAANIQQPEGIALLDAGHLVVVETGTGNVLSVDVATGEKTVLAEAISPGITFLDIAPAWGINAVAVGSSGSVYVTSPADGHVYRIRFE